MKTKYLMVAAVALVAAFTAPRAATQSAGVPAGATQKIAVLDVRGAIAATAEGKQAAAEFQSAFAPRQNELDAIRKQIQDLQKRGEAGERTLSDEEKGRIARDIDRLQRLGQRKQDDLREDLQEADQEIGSRIGGKMREVVDRYARENAITLILDASAQGAGIVWGSPAVDITQDIVRLYDAAHPLKAGAQAPGKAPAQPPAKAPAKPPQQ